MRLEEAQRAVLEDTERRVASIAAERLEKAALEFRERLEALAEQAVSNALGRLADERGEVAESAVERGGRMGMATRVEQEVARMILEAGQAMPARVDEPLHPE